jgi:membrane-associated phospholipid phosphatase
MGGNEPWAFLYQYGTIPGLVLAVSALFIWIGSYFSERLLPLRRESLLVVLTVIIAAGILVNAVLKQYWGRPRPSQIIEFGGNWQYRPIFPPGPPGKGASFPCGHCAMGFVFLSLLSFYPRSKWVALSGGLVGIILGGMLSAARIIQGAHFLTDTLWSMGIVVMVAILLHYLVFRIPAPVDAKQLTQKTTPQKTVRIAAALIIIIAMSIAFMTRRPYYQTYRFDTRLEQATAGILIYTNTDPERVQIHYDDTQQSRIEIHAHGFGWMGQDHAMQADHVNRGPRQIWSLKADARSYFAELYYAIDIYLPHSAQNRLTVDVKENQTVSDLKKALMLNTAAPHP